MKAKKLFLSTSKAILTEFLSMLEIVAIKLNTVSNSRKSSIQTLHKDLERSTTQSTFKKISAGLTRQTKNEEKDSNSSNASFFTSVLLRIQQPSSRERCDKIWACFRRYCCGFLSTLYKSFGL